jgi:putative ABC transport system ATP-binding protein
MLELTGVTKQFDNPDGTKSQVLQGIDLQLGTGEFAIIIGPNGCGKSTLLNAIAGRIDGVQGSIRVDGVEIAQMPEHRRAALIGRVVQNPSLGTCPSLTIAENMRLADLRGQRRHLRLGLKSERPGYAELLKRCEMGLEDRLNQLSGTLSGGQRQALALVLATMRRPKLLLLDEHTAALDPRASEQVARMTTEIIREEKLCALMVTHSMHQAVEMGDRTLIMHEGRIAEDLRGPQRVRLAAEDLVERLNDLYRLELSRN